jgi:2-polyprenyl-3-methyl-5-hydroxy-6-metoxy-1,4-benzoquinol methylase
MNKTEKFWDGLAKEIDPQSDQLDPEQTRMVKKISHYIKPSDTILDYGCARGGIALAIADKVKEVQGIDISSKMIAIAKKRAAARKISNVRFDHTVISDKRLEPESFNVVIALNVFHLVEDHELIVERISKLLKPGGLLITLTPCLGDKRNFLSGLAIPLLRFITKLGIIPPVCFLKIAAFEAMLKQIGFELNETKSIQESIATSLFVIAKKTESVE